GAWQSNDYTYTAASVSASKGVITSPANGSTLSGASVTFTWAAGNGAAAYWLDVNDTCTGCGGAIIGREVGRASGELVNGIPTTGGTIYVRLWTLLSGTWQSNDYTYTAATQLSKGVITNPANGSTLGGATVTFTWNAGSGASAYWLDVNNTCTGCGGG